MRAERGLVDRAKRTPRNERHVALLTVTESATEDKVARHVRAALALRVEVVELERGAAAALRGRSAVAAAVTIARLDLTGDFAEALREALTTGAAVSFAALHAEKTNRDSYNRQAKNQRKL